MSERMNKERAREILKELSKKEILLFQGKTNEELHQALDIAIDTLNKIDDIEKHIDDTNKSNYQTICKLVDNIGELESQVEKIKAEKMEVYRQWNNDTKDNEWVDVRDRLPKDRDYYLVCGKEKHEIGFACYNQDLGVWYLSPDDMHYGDYEIIAWKPLPKPYERKE